MNRTRGRRGLGAPFALAGVLLAAGLPLLTVALATSRNHLSLADDLLIYLVAVVAIAVVGGFWPAVLAAVMSSLLLNWYFTPPLHTLSIAEPRSLLALLLFVTVAVTVSSVVHLSARRAVQAARSADEAASLATSDFTVDLAAKRVRRGECDIRLTPTGWRAWWRRSCSWACGTPGPRC
jgi:two-component system sensor histidine kinase KdpD